MELDWVEYQRGGDWYATIAKQIVRVESFFDFPASLIAFGESLSSSYLVGINEEAFFRVRGNYLTMISYQSTPEAAGKIIRALIKSGLMVGTLGSENGNLPGLPCVKDVYEWCVNKDWTPEKAILSRSGERRRKLRRCLENYPQLLGIELLHDGADRTDAEKLHEQWILWRKATTNGMIITGHFKRWLERHFEFGDTKLLGFRRHDTGQLVGMFGYETHLGRSQITVMKTMQQPDLRSLGEFVWMVGIESAIIKDGTEKLYAGSYCNELKKYLGMNRVMSYKLRLKDSRALV